MKYLLSLILSSFVLYCSAQNVGIGTSSPLARLHVADSGVVFTGPATLTGTTNFAPPVSGAGARMMWYPQKAAFRAGVIEGDQWDKDNIGIASIALGKNAKASGDYSTSFGLGTNATGNTSTSLGILSIASGSFSTSMGNQTEAIGTNATSMGYLTAAYGDAATSMGYGSFAVGSYSFATGSGTAANADMSTAMGSKTIAQNTNSLVIGQFNDYFATNSLFEIGNGTSEYDRRNALTVLLNGRVGIGTLSPSGQVDIFSGTVAPQLNLTQSDQDFSRIRLKNAYSSINGRYFDMAGFIGTSASLDRLNFYHFGVGDILTLTGTGNAGLGTTNPSLVSGGKGLHVLNSNYTQLRLESSGSSAGLELDPGGTGRQYEIQADINSNLFVYDRGLNQYRLYMNSSGNLGIGNTNPTQTLTVTGNILASGTITPSDLRLKDHIRPITNALLKLEGLHGVYYEYKVTEHPELPLAKGQQTGVIAQEVEAVLPEAVITDPSGYKMVDYTKLVPLLIESVKSQQELIRLQQEKLEQLLQRIEKLEQDGKRKN